MTSCWSPSIVVLVVVVGLVGRFLSLSVLPRALARLLTAFSLAACQQANSPHDVYRLTYNDLPKTLSPPSMPVDLNALPSPDDVAARPPSFFSMWPARESRAQIRCFQCASRSPMDMVRGAGVHPGVYLSAVALDDVPVTHECRHEFGASRALRDGALVPSCTHGVCVKMNYTERATGYCSSSGYCSAGVNDVMRVCLPQSGGTFKSMCNAFESREAFGEWCACDTHLCNHAVRSLTNRAFVLLAALLLFAK